MLRNWWAVTDGRVVEVLFGTDRDAVEKAKRCARRASAAFDWRPATLAESWNCSLKTRVALTERERQALAHDADSPPAPDRPQFWLLVAAEGAHVPYYGTAEEALTLVLRDPGRYVRVEPASAAETRAAQAVLRAAAGETKVRVLSAPAALLVVPGHEAIRAH